VVAGVGLPVLVLLAGCVAAAWFWERQRRRRQQAQERQLELQYGQLREHVRLGRWPEARAALDGMRAIDAHYRDVQQIEGMVSSAESQTWRLQQLYESGVAAYRARSWPEAIQALRAIEAEAPYYRNVRFLERTAALYADLASRDRSLRLVAAKELGEVADLVDMLPLVHALSDPSAEVADAAEASFRRIGLQAFDALLAGLADSQPSYERSYRLLSALGQAARDNLVGALRSSEPRITRAAAGLLFSLGATDELVASLNWITEEHQAGLVDALLKEGVGAFATLVQGLFAAPPERRELFVRVLVALRTIESVDRPLEELARSTKDQRQRVLLRRVLAAEPEAFHTGVSPARPAVSPASVTATETPAAAAAPRRLRILGQRTESNRPTGG
jgi:hypothetical protein